MAGFGAFSRHAFQNSAFQTDNAPPQGGGGKRKKPQEIERLQHLPNRQKKKKRLPIRPIWDRPEVAAPAPAQRAPEFPPPIIHAPQVIQHGPPPVPQRAPQMVAGIPNPSSSTAAANLQDMQDAQDALAAIGMVFHDDQEAGDALAALAAAGLL